MRVSNIAHFVLNQLQVNETILSRLKPRYLTYTKQYRQCGESTMIGRIIKRDFLEEMDVLIRSPLEQLTLPYHSMDRWLADWAKELLNESTTQRNQGSSK